MERKIGETFEYKGRKLKTIEKEGIDDCDGCVLFKEDCKMVHDFVGECEGKKRSDNKGVVFVNADEFDEQPEEQAEQLQAEQQSQKLNLCEILKDCPMYEPFWSPMLGDVKFHHIDHEAKRILITLKTGTQWDINPDATITFANVTSPEIMLFPSKDQRDWSKFTAPWFKKERFDPKTLSPFDRVLGRNHGSHRWACDLFSDIIDGDECMYHCIGSYYRYCIPYNDDTKHLLDTKEEAPVFYRYWED